MELYRLQGCLLEAQSEVVLSKKGIQVLSGGKTHWFCKDRSQPGKLFTKFLNLSG